VITLERIMRYRIILERSPKIRCKFEFRAPDLPQKNGKIEGTFATVYGRVRAILNGAEFTPALRNIIWDFSSLHATRIDNILISPDTHLSP
jgi:hypothetical protein